MWRFYLENKKSINYGVLLFFISFFSLIITNKDIGLTWDEEYYVHHSILIENSIKSLDLDSIKKAFYYDRLRNCHPPFYKISGIIIGETLGKLFFDNPLFKFRVSTIFWSSVFIIFFYFYLLLAYKDLKGKELFAFISSLIMLFIPRFFGHYHLLTTDALVMIFGFISMVLFYFYGHRNIFLIFSSLFLGFLLATKITGILVFPVLIVLGLLEEDKKSYYKRFTIYLFLGTIFFILSDFYYLLDFKRELKWYFYTGFKRNEFTLISTYWMGKFYSYIYPPRIYWEKLFYMLPEIVIIFFILGVLYILSLYYVNIKKTYYKFNYKDIKKLNFEFISFFLLSVIFSLPNIQKHDGIRLFSLGWPYLVLISIRGVYFLGKILEDLKIKERTYWLYIICFYFVLIIMDNFTISPYYLSYYNEFIGGLRGAQEKGCPISYWYDALNIQFLREIKKFIEKNEPKGRVIRVFSYPNREILIYNQYLKLLTAKNIITTFKLDKADYILYLNRYPKKVEFSFTQGTGVIKDNVLIIGFFKNE